MAYDENGNWTDDNQDNQGQQVQNPNGIGQGQGVAPPASPAAPTADPWNKAARNSVRDAWMSGSGSLEDFVKNSPYAGHIHANNDILTIDQTADDPYQWGAEKIDAVGDYGGKNSHEWTGIGPGSGGTPPPPGAGGAGGAGTPGLDMGGAGGYMAGGGTGANSNSALLDEMLNRYRTRADQSLKVGVNDPTIRSQVDPYAAQQERERKNYLSGLAEQRGNNSNIGAEARSSAEQAGQASGLLASQLVGREITARRDEIQNALTSMTGIMSDQQKMALQEELTKLNIAAQKYGIDVGAQTSQNSLAQQWQQALLNQQQYYSGLGAQQSQFAQQERDKYNGF